MVLVTMAEKNVAVGIAVAGIPLGAGLLYYVNKCKKLESDLANCTANVGKYTQSLAEAEAIITEQKNTITGLEAEVARLTEENTALRTSLDECNKSVSILTDENNRLTLENRVLSTRLEDCVKANEALTIENDTLKTEIVTIQRDLAECNKANADLKKEINRLNSILRELHSIICAIDRELVGVCAMAWTVFARTCPSVAGNIKAIRDILVSVVGVCP